MTTIEQAQKALMDHIDATCRLSFEGDIVKGDVVVRNVTSFAGLLENLLVIGQGIAENSLITAIDEGAGTITLSLPALADGTQSSLQSGFLTTGRRVKHWSEVPEQPAFFLRRTSMDDSADGLFVATTIECEAWIYCAAGQDPDLPPDQALTALEQLVRNSMSPDADYGDPRFTIGGLVYFCRIEGQGDVAPGDQSGQAITRLPIRIMMP